MIVGIAMVRDEADIIGATVSNMLRQVDHIIVADNGSTDGTRDILNDFGTHVTVKDDPEVGYYQSAKMTALAAEAGAQGAEWVVPFDADELWYSPFGTIKEVLEDRPETIATAQLYNHVATGLDSDESDPVSRIRWRSEDALPLPKVACRPRPSVTIHQGNHAADYGGTLEGQLVIRHFPYRAPEQFERKIRNGAAAYATTSLPDDIGEHWRQFGTILAEGGPEALRAHFYNRFYVEDPNSEPGLLLDPCPTLSSPGEAAAPIVSAL